MNNTNAKRFYNIVLFSLKQLVVYMEVRNSEYRNNKEFESKKPIVFRENLAVYDEELLYLKHTIEYISKMDVSHIDNYIDMKKHIIETVNKYYKENGIPNICFVILNEKLNLCQEFYENLFKE